MTLSMNIMKNMEMNTVMNYDQNPGESPLRNTEALFERLARSNFRRKFRLSDKDFDYIEKKGIETIRSHAYDFIEKRLAPAEIPNDGKQTPMRGHPVFIAQHATATCCRGCLKKWHGIEPGSQLTKNQVDYVVDVIMEWIKREESWKF